MENHQINVHAYFLNEPLPLHLLAFVRMMQRLSSLPKNWPSSPTQHCLTFLLFMFLSLRNLTYSLLFFLFSFLAVCAKGKTPSHRETPKLRHLVPPWWWEWLQSGTSSHGEWPSDYAWLKWPPVRSQHSTSGTLVGDSTTRPSCWVNALTGG